MKVYFFADSAIHYKPTSNGEFHVNDLYNSRPVSDIEMARYLKMRYRNRRMFHEMFLKRVQEYVNDPWVSRLERLYDQVDPYTYREAFQIGDQEWRSIVFGQIRVQQMIAELGHSRIAVEGRPVRHKQFDRDGRFTGYREYDVIFETHRVNGSKLGLRDDIYAVKCWCTTTESEHWIWIEEKYKDSPLEAIASTFRVHENLIPFIKELKRQGDILLVELTQQIDPRGDMVSLNADQYFSLLTAQS